MGMALYRLVSTIDEDFEPSKEIEEESWSNIPGDVLILIMLRLPKMDRLRLGSTCKSYQTVLENEEILSIENAPLSLSPHLLFLTDQLHHPFLNLTYTTDFEEIENGVIRDSNYGWFLMTQRWDDIFFYNPKTDVAIDLPDLPENSAFRWTLHFTSPPTSMDCEVIGFALFCNYPDFQMGICRIKRNQKDWTVDKVPYERFFQLSSCKPIFFNGICYCLGKTGDIMKYNPSNNECSYHKSDDLIWEKLATCYAHRYMVESDGELLAVFVDREGSWVGVFRLNTEQMVFETVSNLGNKMLFLSNERSYSETATEKGTENKIYLPKFYGEDSVFYSLDTNKFHTFAGYTSDDLYGTESYGASFWMKLNFDEDCTEQFEW